ncbi:MAG: hypothetical protein FJ184_13530 [Gammaproteobacteria bacterium]|nr:hypothetical protein [Gammaproteobacteria bacterium]
MSQDLNDGGFVDPNDELILIPPGIYEAQFICYETRRLNGHFSAKVEITFEITDEGPYKGIRLKKYYPAKDIHGSPRLRGGFTVSPKSDLYRDYVRLIGKPSRADRIRLVRYEGRTIIIEIDTVTHDGNKRPIPEGAQYSVVRHIASVSALLPLRQTSSSGDLGLNLSNPPPDDDIL